jgi:hypothetical protein
MVGGIKTENRAFYPKMPLGFILLTAIHAKWPKLVPYLVQTLNSLYSQNQIIFKAENFGPISVSYFTDLFVNELFWPCPMF